METKNGRNCQQRQTRGGRPSALTGPREGIENKQKTQATGGVALSLMMFIEIVRSKHRVNEMQ